MNILITGGAGFIGSHLAEHHLQKQDKVYAMDNLSTGCLDNIVALKENPNYQFEYADILTWQKLEETIEWADRIYHMAAVVGVFEVLKEPEKVLSVNIKSCERILETVQRLKQNQTKRILLASSSEVYGPNPNPVFAEEDTLMLEGQYKNHWSYAISKLANEALGLAYCQREKIPITMVRLFNTTGSRQSGRYGMVVPRFIQQALTHQMITVFGEGEQTRSFCDVRDMVVMLDELASSSDAIGEIVNAGNDQEISINELAKKVKFLTNSTSIIEHVPYAQAYSTAYSDILRRCPSLKKLFKLITYRPQWGIEALIQSMIKHISKFAVESEGRGGSEHRSGAP